MSGARDPFIGVWKLVSVKRTSPDGHIDHPYGQAPIGRLTYDAAGRMSAQLMQTGRHANAGIREALESYVAYFGTYDVYEPAATVVHHVEASLEPTWVGSNQTRSYRFEANRLVLTAVTTSVFELTWKRDAL